MSVINTMLRDLDERHAVLPAEGDAPPREVRAVRSKGAGTRWFWPCLAALMLVALGWMGWVVYQTQPRTAVTEQAYVAAEKARQAVEKARQAAAVPAPAEPPGPASGQPGVAEAEPPAPDVTASMRLAEAIQTPIRERAAPAAPKATPAAPPVPHAKPAAPAAAQTSAQPLVNLEKRDVAQSPAQLAEAEFARGAAFLKQGRMSEAEDRFRAALAHHAGHEPARQAIAAMLIEQARLDDAKKVLQEGLALNPGHVVFATALARILAERRDYAAAVDVLNAARSAGRPSAELSFLHGSLLQRLGNHRDAVEAYRTSLGLQPDHGAAWVGLGISLESLGRLPDASQAYRRALGSGHIEQELKAYADQRLRRLR